MGEKAQKAQIRAIKDFAAFPGRSPGAAISRPCSGSPPACPLLRLTREHLVAMHPGVPHAPPGPNPRPLDASRQTHFREVMLLMSSAIPAPTTIAVAIAIAGS